MHGDKCCQAKPSSQALESFIYILHSAEQASCSLTSVYTVHCSLEGLEKNRYRIKNPEKVIRKQALYISNETVLKVVL
jgi:hypothetical protein